MIRLRDSAAHLALGMRLLDLSRSAQLVGRRHCQWRARAGTSASGRSFSWTASWTTHVSWTAWPEVRLRQRRPLPAVPARTGTLIARVTCTMSEHSAAGAALPAAHGVGAVAPSEQAWPVGQVWQLLSDVSPVALPNVPESHGLAIVEPTGQ